MSSNLLVKLWCGSGNEFSLPAYNWVYWQHKCYCRVFSALEVSFHLSSNDDEWTFFKKINKKFTHHLSSNKVPKSVKTIKKAWKINRSWKQSRILTGLITLSLVYDLIICANSTLTSFSMSERLCGSVMCADCSRFIEWDFCRKLINPSNISVYRYVNI